MGENDRELDHAALGAAEVNHARSSAGRTNFSAARAATPLFAKYQRYVQAEIKAGRQPLSEHKWLEKFSEEHQTP